MIMRTAIMISIRTKVVYIVFLAYSKLVVDFSSDKSNEKELENQDKVFLCFDYIQQSSFFSGRPIFFFGSAGIANSSRHSLSGAKKCLPSFF